MLSLPLASELQRLQRSQGERERLERSFRKGMLLLDIEIATAIGRVLFY